MCKPTPIKLADGREFESLHDCARALNMEYHTLWHRLEKGYEPFTERRCIKGRPPHRVFFRGKYWPTAKDAAKANDCSTDMVHYYIKKQRASQF